jgi:type IV pilus assembly protein PilO
MSAMADFARMPTRQKVMAFAVMGMLLGLLYYQFVYKGLKADLEAALNENASKNATNKRLEADIPAFEALKARMTVLKKIIDENQKALPTEAELPAFFETLNRKVLESGIEVVRSRQLAEEKIERFVRVPVEYEVSGTYVQIKKFFASLVPKRKKPGQAEPTPGAEQEVQEQERIVSIENLTLANPTVRNREYRLTARFVASTYRMEDGSAPAPAPRRAPAAAPTPAPAPSGGGGMAPQATPQGAQQRTDKAMEKNEQRNPSDDKVLDAPTVPGGTGTPKSGMDRMKGGI